MESGQVFDGNCQIYRANPDTLGDGDQSEDQLPVFRMKPSSVLRNVVLRDSAANGIHVYGVAKMEDVHWLDVGEDALTMKAPGTMHVDCGSATLGADKVFQVNQPSTLHIENFHASDSGKFMRQNGGTDFPVRALIDHCDISNMRVGIFTTDGANSYVSLTHSLYSEMDDLFFFEGVGFSSDSAQSCVYNSTEY